MNINKLNEVLKKPELERDFKEVFAFVETITAQNFSVGALTHEDIEIWDQKFGDVLKQLLSIGG